VSGPGPPLIVVARAVHPTPRSAEAVVTGALLDALRARGWDLQLLTSPAGWEPLDGQAPPSAAQVWAGGEATGLAAGLHEPATRPRGALARAVDRTRALLGLTPLQVATWAAPTATELHRRLHATPGAVVWARSLPEHAFEAVLDVRRRRPFPLLCSSSDPIPPARGGRTSTDRALHRLGTDQHRTLGRLADGWTFPARRVLDQTAQVAGIDPEAAAVVPHVLPTARGGRQPGPGAPPRLVYAGTPYRWLLRPGLVGALQEAAEAGEVQPVFALKGTDADAVARLRAALPTAEVHVDLAPDEAAHLVAGADAALVAVASPEIFPTKVAESVRHARPVLALAPVPSTTAEVVEAAGGVVVATDGGPGGDADPQAVRAGLRAVLHPSTASTAQALEVARRLGTEAVLGDVERVVTAVVERHQARAAGAPPPPLAPDLRWP